ncbi:MAG: hypothetical protein KME15_22400 [Drouetiella hepatica Uher 2000/2452]|jgi:hypothetical protein|uniref:Uncharacterized protein n=1 Tax=Drouetiella hepatica Uher 2000/2452 TaxID=904376 RepID=A0A951UPF0_9CYAN|nr:hypothetical protein [Drouetiella hepatica Uher 2000/2452]
MNLDKILLAQNMAFLIAIPPDSNLAKLLSFCLTTKARANLSGIELIKLTCELIEKPSNIAYWTQDVMGLNFDYSSEEWKSLGEMGITNPTEFMASVWQELENLEL